MAVNEDSNGIFEVYSLENIFFAGSVDEGPLGIINKEGMAMGVFAPGEWIWETLFQNQTSRPSWDSIFDASPGFRAGP